MTHETALSLAVFYGLMAVLGVVGLVTGYFPARFGPPLHGALARLAVIVMWGLIVLATVALAVPDQAALAWGLLVIWLALFYGIGYRLRRVRPRESFLRLDRAGRKEKGKRKRGGL